MSRHIPRHARWSSQGPIRWISAHGPVVLFAKGAWWADITYRLLATATETGELVAETQADRLGPFKRSRNAMVEAERHMTALRNRHGEAIRFDAA